jgi:hypothetical protein
MATGGEARDNLVVTLVGVLASRPPTPEEHVRVFIAHQPRKR